jgi:hypothetical protein
MLMTRTTMEPRERMVGDVASAAAPGGLTPCGHVRVQKHRFQNAASTQMIGSRHQQEANQSLLSEQMPGLTSDCRQTCVR